MNVKKIFTVLITIVVCVVIGALVLNILMPNATRSLINTTEKMIHNATGLEFDFNGDGVTGKTGTTTVIDGNSDKSNTGVNVDGFE